MKITALEEYGLRCLLRVAEQPPGESISAQAVADLEGMSLPYTQKILRTLTQGGLIDSRRGAQGGFLLALPAEEISLGDVIRVLGGLFEVEDICERHTGELERCARGCGCTIRPVWSFISRFVIETLDGISVAALLADEASVRRHLSRQHHQHQERPLPGSAPQ
ncbi:transcriptional regulator [Lujinxingia litoralis]|uniref:Transcriptional regulator n=1 Tax=Lujinxingia litoralis TaxID=2211119 RepID=A0A328C9F0_9DELT|nr:Rrf2 family transcriptional regulator [Lujinxingia litoralis]RAL25257.1 transcriptional regulator [Lujinxingia litoralis]